ncbi:tetratricopeptide repeat protein [Undibacterium sp. TJN19]|uniref:tetratricopeptide repeat protein n=1 Tax=Undibacterium sp. TJN19 TaxID=3413055 RepID=UPI003BF2A420
MHSKLKSGFTCFALLISLSMVGSCAQATPFIPSNGKQVLEQLPLRTDPVQREFAQLRKRLAEKPGDHEIAAELAQAYINTARNDGDPRYLGYAQAALKPWWNLPAPPISVLVLRATILQSTHQFPAALTDLNSVLKQDRNNAQAWLTRATVLQVQGQFAQAKASCMHLYPLAQELITLTCLHNVGSLNGEAASSYTALSTAYKKSTDTDSGTKIWVATLLAEMSARLSDAKTADDWYKKALTLAVPDSYLLGSYADFLLDQQRPAEVVTLLKNKTRVDALLLRYALALQAQQSPAAAEQIRLLDQRFDAAILRGDTVHQREQARYELQLKNRPAAALKLALLNWDIQKEVADLRILLEAAAAQNPQAAAPAIAWLKQNKLEDSSLKTVLAKLEAKP